MGFFDGLFGAASGSVKTTNHAQNASSAQQKENWNYYKDTFQPLTGQMIDMTSATARSDGLQRTLADFDKSINSTSGISKRNNARFGIDSPQQSRMSLLNNTAQRNATVGNTLNSIDDRNYGLLQGISNQGALINGNATKIYQQTAMQEAQRNAAAKAMAQQAQAGLFGGLASFGLGTFAGMGG